jgi:hypothetical protein
MNKLFLWKIAVVYEIIYLPVIVVRQQFKSRYYFPDEVPYRYGR